MRILEQKYRLLETTAIIPLAAGFIACGSNYAYAGPTGGNVDIGTADIVYSGTATTITQTTAKSVINWQSFDTTAGETVRFIQPSSDAITLNRINNGSPTKFDGNLLANGNVWVINPNGVFFGASAKIDVSGIVASTADITDDNFKAGNYKFDIAGESDAGIINDGDITIREAGIAGFVAPHLENNGVINARLGKVHLAGADTATLDLYGDGLIELAVTDKDTAKTVVQNGIISADGGTVVIKAAAGKEITDNIISMKGVIEANTVEQNNGKIILSADGGDVTISGTITAKGNDENETGGAVIVTGKDVTVKETAYIDVSGITDGGTVRIGGGYQGGEGIYASDFTSVESGAVIKADAIKNGNGGSIVIWSDGNTDYNGHISALGGEESGNGGEIEVSGKELLGFNGTVDATAANGETGNLLLDPTDIIISNNTDSNVSGTTTRTPSADDVVSNLNITTLQTALAAANVTVQTRATGTQAGDITVSNALAWTSGRTLTLTAAHDIIVNSTISAGTNGSIVMNVGNTVALNAAVSGTGTFSILNTNLASTIGLGDTQVGTLNLDTSEIGRITNGWAGIVIGQTTGTGAINIDTLTWNDPLTVRTNTGIITVNGNQTFAASTGVAFSTNADIALNGNLISTGAGANADVTFTNSTASTTFGIGDGQAGTINFTNAELARITNGWRNIYFGSTAATGTMNVGAYTWNDGVYLNSLSSTININGNQNFGANSLYMRSNTRPVLNGTLTGTGTVYFISPTASMAVGDSQTGTVQLTESYLSNFSGWTGYYFHSNSGAMNVAARTWGGRAYLNSTSGVISINGNQDFGNKNLDISTASNIIINGNLTGTGTLTFAPTATLGIGDGQTGTVNLSNAELARIQDGWANLIFGNTSTTTAVNIGASSWLDSTQFYTNSGPLNINGAVETNNNNLLLQTSSGLLTIGGPVNTGTGNLSIITNSNLAINNTLSGTGTLSLYPVTAATTIGIGDGQAGTFSLTDAEIANISDGWSNIIFGTTGTTGLINVGAMSWNDNVTLRSSTGIISINGTQNAVANNMTFISGANINLNADLNGSGILTIQGNVTSSSIGLGTGSGGIINLDDTELTHLVSGWQEVIFGRTDSTGIITIGANTWNNNTTFKTNTGVITVSGAQDFGTNNATLETNANPAINAALTGSGILTFRQTSAATTIGTTGTVNITAAEIGQITDGWNNIVIGRNDGTGAFIMGGPITWNDNVTFLSGTGLMTISGIQNFGSNDFTIQTDSALTISAALNGTGTLTVMPSSITTTIGLGGAAGTLNLTTAEMNLFTNGWGNILIGRNDLTSTVTINALTLNDPITIISNGTINLDGVLTSNAGTGTVVTLVGNNIVNTAGASAINTNAGRFLVYTANRAGNTQGGITPTFNRYSCTYNGSCPSVPATGNGFLYAETPILTVTPDAITALTYGDSVPNLNGYSYSVSGYLAGDSGIDTVTGTINGSTSYTISSNAGTSYNIDYTSGSLTSALGYVFTYTNNTSAFSVNKATLTATASNGTRLYGDANPALTVSYSGFKNGETSAVIDTLASASSAADVFSNVGTYSTVASGASDNNYDFSYINGTLTINKAILTLTADNKQKDYNQPDPVLTYTTSGYKNSDTSSVLTGEPGRSSGEASGTYSITSGTISDITGNYAITFIPGTFIINQSVTVPVPTTATATNVTLEQNHTISDKTVTGPLNFELSPLPLTFDFFNFNDYEPQSGEEYLRVLYSPYSMDYDEEYLKSI